ncbi:PREDICTED: EEIG1/EHBP1 [Prunus dulcis]|uniref:PREDICTED: EEIG1/EHBP1 n=1 Tax=Prunus dulcis TaxID=3755 RepID=A0A5E4G4T7_PRUDU|nr:PREDICTED: EEIG1/EHBP1 [Prunus dulcis]
MMGLGCARLERRKSPRRFGVALGVLFGYLQFGLGYGGRHKVVADRWFDSYEFGKRWLLTGSFGAWRPCGGLAKDGLFVPEKSFIGFFHPEELENRDFEFLQGAISFDSNWMRSIEQDAFYIIDTLGERLYEGCNQAYILKFDKDTTIQILPSEAKASYEKSGNRVRPNNCKETKAEGALVVTRKDLENSDVEEEVVCKGREACKDFIKSFLAVIPIRELLADLKKGLMASTPLRHRLQIEFHCTKLLQSMDEYSVRETAAAAPAMAMALAVA